MKSDKVGLELNEVKFLNF